MKNIKRKQQGMTLIEIAIVIAIIGILSAIALPSYLNNIRETQRATAQARMLEIESLLSEHFVQNGRYTEAYVDNLLLDASLINTPNATDPRYTINIDELGASEQTYRITSTPVNGQVGDMCGILTINSMGQKKSSTGDTCW